jgi:hypothetical protein
MERFARIGNNLSADFVNTVVSFDHDGGTLRSASDVVDFLVVTGAISSPEAELVHAQCADQVVGERFFATALELRTALRAAPASNSCRSTTAATGSNGATCSTIRRSRSYRSHGTRRVCSRPRARPCESARVRTACDTFTTIRVPVAAGGARWRSAGTARRPPPLRSVTPLVGRKSAYGISVAEPASLNPW